MINVRRNIFETNSSSNHNLTIISDDTYQRWRNHEITLKISYEYDGELNNGDNGFLGTWGNFFLEQGNVEISDISNTRDKNVKSLEEVLYDWVYPHFSEEVQKRYLADMEEYAKKKKIGEYLHKYAGADNLFLTPEEYEESLKYTDCQSPFLYKGSGVVVIGHYYRS